MRKLLVILICSLERRAYKKRQLSLSHMATWAQWSTLRYKALYPNAIHGAW